MHTYIHTLRSDDGRTPRFRDPMARLVLISEMIGCGGRANILPEKNKNILWIDYSDTRLCPSPPPSSAVSWALRPPGLDPLLVDWLVLGQGLRKRGGALFFAAHGPHPHSHCTERRNVVIPSRRSFCAAIACDPAAH